jgi:hypothetical protein
MGIFSRIKNTIFGSKAQAQEAKPAPAPKSGGLADAVKDLGSPQAQAQVVDIESRLDAMDGADRLNWRTSIVDLLKLVGVDSSYENRKELAGELGRSDYSGSAEDNIWLHKATMRELEKNGGKVPPDMLD